MRRTKEEAAITRQSLLKAALVVFSRSGYSAASLEDVAAEACLTRGAIYWHFRSKADLYGALLDATAARSTQIVQAAMAQGGRLTDILRRIFVRLLETVENDPELRAVMEISLFKSERTPELAEIYRLRQESERALLLGIASAFRQGIVSGEMRGDLDPREMAQAFLALQNGAIYQWLYDPQTSSLAASAPAMAEIFLRGVMA